MKAYKCDVCSTLFTQEREPEITVKKYTGDLWPTKFDLCPKCQKQLEDFLLAKPVSPIANEKQAGNKYAAIVFAPVCSNCKNVIPGRVDYNTDVESSSTFREDEFLLRIPKTDRFTPERCPHCGAIVRQITMPTELGQITENLFMHAESRLRDETKL